MVNAVAPESSNTLRGAKVRLCAMAFAPPPALPGKTAGELDGLSDAVLDVVGVRVLEDAHVILVPVASDEASLRPNGAEAIPARTRANGELIWITASELGGSVPADPGRALWLPLGWEYACFWTLHGPLFEQVWQELQQDASAAIQLNPFFRFRTERSRRSGVKSSLPLKRENEAKLELLVHDRAGCYRGVPVHGLLPASRIRETGPQGEIADDATYVLARSDALAALYVGEVASRAAVAKRGATAEDLAVFEGVRGISALAERGERNPELDAELRTFRWRGQQLRRDPRQDALADRFVDYAYLCASARVPETLFWKAVNVHVTQPGWKDAAAEIWRTHRIPHPNLDARGLLQPLRPNAEVVLTYFKLYDLGLRAPAEPWWQASLDADAEIERHLAALSDRLRTFFELRVPYQQFLEELDAHTAREPAPRRELHGFFLQSSLAKGYEWWRGFEPGSEKDWKALEKYVGWIASMSDKLGDFFGTFFEDPDEIFLFNQKLGGSVEAFERFFAKMKAFDGRMPSGTIRRKYGEGMRIEADFTRGVYVVKRPGKAPIEIGPVKFLLVQGEGLQQTVTVQLPRRKSKPRNKRFKQIRREVPVYSAVVTDVPFKDLHEWPRWLGVFGDTVSLAIALASFNEDLKTEQEADVYFKTATNLFQAVGSVGEAVTFVMTKAGKVEGVAARTARFLGAAGGVGQVTEAVYNVKEGLVLILDEKDSAVVEALDRGEEFEAKLLMFKGVVLVSSAVPATVAFGSAVTAALWGGAAATATGGSVLAGAATAAAPPLAIGLALAAVVVVGIEVYLYSAHGPEGAIEPIRKRLKQVVKAEFGDERSPGPSRTARSLSEYCAGVDPILARIAT